MILMAGVYDMEGYSRARVLLKGLRAGGAKVETILPKGKLKYFALAKRFLKKDFSVIIANGKLVLLTAWLLKWWHRKPIVFDVFISDYDTMVVDRKLVAPDSFKAKLLWFGDKWSCHIADKIIHDTEEHIQYFVDEFKVQKNKFAELYLGADNEIFKPVVPQKHEGFVVLFHGTFIPLQGIEYILDAAKRLARYPDIRFELIGSGQTFDEMKALAARLELQNVAFRGFVPISNVPAAYATADVGLGIFGNTPKTKRVIPNKAFEILGMQVPLLTADTAPLRRLVKHGEDSFLCSVADGAAIAGSILALRADKNKTQKMAEHGYQRYLATSSNEQLGKRMLSLLQQWGFHHA